MHCGWKIVFETEIFLRIIEKAVKIKGIKEKTRRRKSQKIKIRVEVKIVVATKNIKFKKIAGERVKQKKIQYKCNKWKQLGGQQF